MECGTASEVSAPEYLICGAHLVMRGKCEGDTAVAVATFPFPN